MTGQTAVPLAIACPICNAVVCPACSAKAGEMCASIVDASKTLEVPHAARVELARKR